MAQGISKSSGCRLAAALLLTLSAPVRAETELFVDVGMGYDSNPNYLPTADAGAAIWSVHPQILHRAWHNPGLEWFVQAGYQANDSELDPRTIRMPSDPASPLVVQPPNNRVGWTAIGLEQYLSESGAVSLALDALDHRHDNEDFNYRTLGFSPDLRVMISDSDRVYLRLDWQRITYENRPVTAAPAESQTDEESGATLGWWHRLSPARAADLSMRYERVASNEAVMESRSVGSTVRMFQLIDARSRLAAILDIEKERFDASTGSAGREDRLLELTLELEIQHTDSVSYSLTGRYSDHHSTFADASYKRTVTSFDTSITF